MPMTILGPFTTRLQALASRAVDEYRSIWIMPLASGSGQFSPVSYGLGNRICYILINLWRMPL
jgi:hypothetical protein